jgi:hypothetical protein
MSLSFLLKTLVHNLFSHFPKHKDTLKNRRKSSNKQGASVSSLLLQLLSTSLQQVREVKKEKESLSNHLR